MANERIQESNTQQPERRYTLARLIGANRTLRVSRPLLGLLALAGATGCEYGGFYVGRAPQAGGPAATPTLTETQALSTQVAVLKEQLEGRTGSTLSPAASGSLRPTEGPRAPAGVATATPEPPRGGAATPTTLTAEDGTFTMAGSNLHLRVESRQGTLGATYATIVTDRPPTDFGLPERLSAIRIPSATEYDNRPRWTAEEFSRPEARNRFGILIPDINRWGPPDWGRQSWAWSPAMMRMTDNFIMKSLGWEGTFVMQRPDMTRDGIVDLALLMNEQYMNDLRWGSGNGNANKRIQTGSDVAMFIDKGRPGTVLFVYNPLTGEYLRRDGKFVNVVVSENGDSGLVLPTQGLTAIGVIGRFGLKIDARDAKQEVTFRFGPTEKAQQMNLADARSLGAR